jgi:hypothetical protein
MSVPAQSGDVQNLSRAPQAVDDVWTGGWGPDDRIVFNRGLPGAPELSDLVRMDFGAAAMLLSAGIVAGMVVAVARTSPPFGAFTLMLTLAVGLVSVPVEAWRFLAVGPGAGLVVDVTIYLTPPAYRLRVAGAVAGMSFVLAFGAVVLATSGLGWTPTLLLGVGLAAGALGWGSGALAERGGGPAPQASGG